MIYRIKRFSRDQYSLEAKLRNHGYSDREISVIIPDLMNLPEELDDLLWNWLDTGEEIDLIRNKQSVLEIMEEDHINYPSALIEFKSKAFSDNDDKKEAKRLGKIGLGLGLGKIGLQSGFLGNEVKKSVNLTEDEEKVLKKIIKENRNNVNFIQGKDISDNSCTHPSLNKKLHNINSSKPTVKIGVATPGTVTHELGHAEFYKKGSKNSIGKIANNPYVYNMSKRISRTGGSIAGLGTGLYASKKKHDTGEEESKGLKYSTAIGSGISRLPVLIAESEASRKGLELLKKSGASKETMKDAKKSMTKAGMTYVLGTGSDMVKTQLSHEAGKWIGDKYYKHKDKKK